MAEAELKANWTLNSRSDRDLEVSSGTSAGESASSSEEVQDSEETGGRDGGIEEQADNNQQDSLARLISSTIGDDILDMAPKI